MVSTYLPECTIFKKSYVPPPKKDERVKYNPKVSLPADFLQDLPESRRKKKRQRRLGLLRGGKEEAKQEKIKKLQEQYKKELMTVENRMKQVGHSSKNRIELLQKRRYRDKTGNTLVPDLSRPGSPAAG